MAILIFRNCCREMDDKLSEGEAAGGLGLVHQQMRDYAKALRYHQTELSIASELNQVMMQARAYSHLGSAYENLGNLTEAIKYHELNLTASSQTNDKLLKAIAHCSLGTYSPPSHSHEKDVLIFSFTPILKMMEIEKLC